MKRNAMIALWLAIGLFVALFWLFRVKSAAQ
jgi:hypothetical protein